MHPCSIIQVSKMESLLHTIFTIEILRIQMIMKKEEEFKEMTNKVLEKVENIYHKVTQYIDDTTSVIGASTNKELKTYMQQYLQLMESFYWHNKLAMNSSKTKFMIMNIGENNNKKIKMKLTDSKGNEIEDVNQLKILGFWTNSIHSMEMQLSKIKGIVISKLSNLQPTMKFLDKPTRKEIIYSKVGSIILYGAALYSGQTEQIKAKFTTLLMKCNLMILNRKTFMERNEVVCREANVSHPEEFVNKAAVKLMKKIIFKQKPKEIFKMIRLSNLPRDSH